MQRSGRYARPGLQSAARNAPLLVRELVPSLDLDFRSGVLDSRIDFQRTTTGTYYRGQFNQNVVRQSQAFNVSPWSFSIATAISTTEIAPDGTATATTLNDASISYADARQASVIPANQQRTFSIYVRKTSGSLSHYPGLGVLCSGVASRVAYVIVNTTSGTVVLDASSSLAGTSFAIVDAGTYWRVSLTFRDDQDNGTTTVLAYPAISSNGTAISNLAQGSSTFWGAQLTEGSLLTPYIPTTTAAITQGQIAAADPWNLFTQSQDIANAGTYTLVGATSANITTTAPDGSTTVTQLTESNVNERHLVGRTAYVALPSIDFPVTISVYLKKVSRRYIQLVGLSSATSSFSAIFDLDTGTITDTRAQSGTYLSGSMVDVGGGWYRCSISGSTSIAQVSLNVVHSNVATFAAGSLSAQSLQYLGDGTSQTLVWGEQLNYGSALLPYRSTTTAGLWLPRFENDPVTGEARGLLIEGGATNLCLQSADFTSVWVNDDTTETANTITSPDGTVSADTITDTATTDFHSIFQSIASLSTTSTYTMSCFIKKGTVRYVVLAQQMSTTNFWGVQVDMDNPTSGGLTTVAAGAGTSVAGATITNIGNGWYRVSVTGIGNSSTHYPSFAHRSTAWTSGGLWESYAGSTANFTYVWGFQYEQQAFASSYIPTTTATVARGRDSAQMLGTNFSSWYNQNEGTFLADWKQAAPGVTEFATAFRASVSTGIANSMWIGKQISAGAGQRIEYEIRGSGTQRLGSSGNVTDPFIRAAGAYQVGGDIGLSYNGVSVASAAYTQAPTPDRLHIGSFDQISAIGPINSTISRLAYWPTRLPDATLQALTT